MTSPGESWRISKIANEGIFRLRSGRFRIYFRIILATRSIEILLFDKRGAIKDKDIQRL